VNDHFDISWLWTTLGTLGGGFVTWLFGRRKQKAETKSNELENIEKGLEIYRNMMEDLKIEHKNLRTEVNSLENKVSQLLDENRSLKQEVHTLENKVSDLLQENRSLKTRISELESHSL